MVNPLLLLLLLLLPIPLSLPEFQHTNPVIRDRIPTLKNIKRINKRSGIELAVCY
jgi:hypothetical protein